MKYLTKEWYNNMQRTGLHLMLKISKDAEEFSEEFYKKIYNIEKKKYLNDQLRIKEILKDKIYPFASFNRNQQNSIKMLKNKLPESILEKVKDIRVLALNYASVEVYNLIKEYCEDNDRFVNERIREYNKLESDQFEPEELDFVDESFHDCEIVKIIKEKDLTIYLDNEHGFTDKSIIIFKNYHIILNENIEDSCWLYNEIYKISNGYEVHILAYSKNGLRELILECSEIIVK